MAHLSNLFRESAAKGKMKVLGLNIDNLKILSEQEGYEYLQNIIALKNNGASLLFDPMNQKAAAALFSKKTVLGLQSIEDVDGANIIELISDGIIGALDTKCQSADARIQSIIKLKDAIEAKNSVIERLRRPSKEDITNELYQMTLATLDSHIYTYVNMKSFHPRRKSTSTVEQFFGQMMMLSDGGSKFTCHQVQGILKRVMMTNATRLLPDLLKGFRFLGKLSVHMKSYTVSSDDELEIAESVVYPTVHANRIVIRPYNSPFDAVPCKRKPVHTTITRNKDKEEELLDVNPRKYLKKF